MSEEIRLSRGFATTSYDQEMPQVELYLKSPVALVLGVVPFTIAYVAMMIFRVSASAGDCLEEKAHGSSGLERFGINSLQTLNAVPGVAIAAVMILMAKLFSLSQQIVWGHYVEKPSGDGSNTRLAQYGSGIKPWEDLKTIAYAFFSPSSLPDDAWKLKQWSQITI